MSQPPLQQYCTNKRTGNAFVSDFARVEEQEARETWQATSSFEAKAAVVL